MCIWGAYVEATPPICNQESMILSFVFPQACLRSGDGPAKCAPKHWLCKSFVLICSNSGKCEYGIKDSLKSCGDDLLDVVGVRRSSDFLSSVWHGDSPAPLILPGISSLQ